ncbi:MAG: O-antigen ligase family protein [Acidobacteriota bacterium]
MSRLLLIVYLATLALLPWMWFPPFPFLHEHAQWSDALFAVTAVIWFFERVSKPQLPRIRPLHFAIAGYFIAATLSLVFASSNALATAPKLLGIGELCLFTIITSDIASRAEMIKPIALTVAISSLAVGLAAITGLALFYFGVPTRLLGTYGDLMPSLYYARVQAATYQPNMLASFCIFAAAIIEHPEANFSVRFRRLVFASLLLTIMLTFSRAILIFLVAALMRRAQSRRQKIIAAVAVIICIGVIALLSFWNLSFDPAHPFAAHFNWNEASSRYTTIATSWQSLIDHPIFGVGLGNSPGFYRGMPFDAHLTPLNIAATLGLPALLAFTAIIFLLWRNRKRPTDLAIWSGLAGMLIDGLANDIEDFRHLWVLFGLADAKSEK